MSLIRNGYTVFRRAGFRGLLFSALLALALFDSGVAAAREIEKEIKLTGKQIQGVINVENELRTLFGGVDLRELFASGDKPEKAQALAKAKAVFEKHGFVDLDEYMNVMMSIQLVMSGINQETKKFIEPPEQIKQEIAALKADKSVPEAEKRDSLAQLEAALNDAKPIQFKENIALVLKYFDKLPPFTATDKQTWCALRLRYLNCRCLMLQLNNPDLHCSASTP